MKARTIEPYNQPEPPNYASWPRWARDMVNLTQHRSYNRGLEDAAKVAETTVYNERPRSVLIAAAIRALKQKDKTGG